MSMSTQNILKFGIENSFPRSIFNSFCVIGLKSISVIIIIIIMWDERYMAGKLLFRCTLLPRFIQNSTQDLRRCNLARSIYPWHHFYSVNVEFHIWSKIQRSLSYWYSFLFRRNFWNVALGREKPWEILGLFIE